MNKEKIENLASNLLIGLTEEENNQILTEFKYIEESIDLITKIPNIDELEPLTHPFPVTVNLCEDLPSESLAIEDVLANAKDISGREVKVPKVVGE